MAFIVYDRALQMLRRLKALLQQVRRHDRPLAEQMQRAAQSTLLNIAEAWRSSARTRRVRGPPRSARGRLEPARFQNGLCEAREARAALKVAIAWQYVSWKSAARSDADLDRVAGMLWPLIHRPRRR